MEEYKGIYYGEKKEQRFFEGGAHFRYKDLYKILIILGGEIQEKNRRNSNSKDLISKSNFSDKLNIQKGQSRNLNKLNYVNNPNTKVSNNSLFSNSKNECKPFLFQKMNLKKSSNNLSKNDNQRVNSNIKLRNFTFERISSKSSNKNEVIKNSSSNKNKNIQNLKLNNITSNRNIILNNHHTINISNNNKLFNYQLNNNKAINNMNTIYSNTNYFDNYLLNNNNNPHSNKRSRNNYQHHTGHVKSIDLKNKFGLANAKSSEGINFNKTINQTHKSDKNNSEIDNIVKKKNEHYVIIPRKDNIKNNSGNFNLGFTLFNYDKNNFKKNLSSIYK